MLCCIGVRISAQPDADKEMIKYALLDITGKYPDAQLADVYKTFYQDMFGPGHLLEDSTMAQYYVFDEIAANDTLVGVLYEPTGYHGNYVRVNLSTIAYSMIPMSVYMLAFTNSIAKKEAEPSPQQWISMWSRIEECIAELGLRFPNEEQDRMMIASKMDSLDFPMHHSERFNNTYKLHYRIINRDVFTRDLLPLIYKNKK